MKEKEKPNSGVLFVNEKGGNETRPDYKGRGLVEVSGQPVELDIAAWNRKSKTGTSYLHLAIKHKLGNSPS